MTNNPKSRRAGSCLNRLPCEYHLLFTPNAYNLFYLETSQVISWIPAAWSDLPRSRGRSRKECQRAMLRTFKIYQTATVTVLGRRYSKDTDLKDIWSCTKQS